MKSRFCNSHPSCVEMIRLCGLTDNRVADKAEDDLVFTRAKGQPVGGFRKRWENLTTLAGLSGLLLMICDVQPSATWYGEAFPKPWP